VNKVALVQVFSDYFGFPCQFSFHRLLHTHHLSSGAATIGQLVADVPSGLILTPPHEIKKNVSEEHSYVSTKLHGVIFKNTVMLMTTVMKTSNFRHTKDYFLYVC
jgi:hypothetical protein